MFVSPGSRLAPTRASIARTQKAQFFAPFRLSFSGNFVAASTQYLGRAIGTSYNGKTCTLSLFLKTSGNGANSPGLFGVTDGVSNNNHIFFDASGHLNFAGVGTPSMSLITTPTYDDNAWHHVCIGIDTTQATASNRVTIEVDGAAPSLSTSTYPSQNVSMEWASTNTTSLGNLDATSGSGACWNGLIGEFYYIDNQKLTHTSFVNGSGAGTTYAKKYSGTFGSKDMYLGFTNSGNLGADSSGNALNWTNNGAVTQSTTAPPY